MKFSLRDLLALVLLSALGMLAWRSYQDARREQARVMQLQVEIKTLETQLRLDDPSIHQAILHTEDEHAALRAMKERSLAHFEKLRDKYSAMEPRGADVFSLRSIPAMSADSGSTPVIYRMLVPANRAVWLKFGVHLSAQNSYSPRNRDNDRDLLTESPFDTSGPFELQLPPGDQTLKIAIGTGRNGSLPVVISLNDQALLRTSYDMPGVNGTGSSYTSALSQLDVAPGMDLPWLITSTVNLDKAAQPSHSFSLWLSNQASDYKAFPRD